MAGIRKMQTRPRRLTDRPLASEAGNTGSIPVEGTIRQSKKHHCILRRLCFDFLERGVLDLRDQSGDFDDEGWFIAFSSMWNGR